MNSVTPDVRDETSPHPVAVPQLEVDGPETAHEDDKEADPVMDDSRESSSPSTEPLSASAAGPAGLAGPGDHGETGDTWSGAHDNALRRAAAFGDLEAFNEIVNRHGPAMFRYARRTVADPGDAEEAVQDAFVSAWKTLPDFRGDSSLRTWLFTITRRKAIDVVRKRRPVPVADDLMTELAVLDDPGPGGGSGSGLMEAFGVALSRLPESQRSTWLLREVEEMSYAEIAGVLRTTETSVRGTLARARANLQTQLGAWKP